MAASSHGFSDVNDVHRGFFVRHCMGEAECGFNAGAKMKEEALPGVGSAVCTSLYAGSFRVRQTRAAISLSGAPDATAHDMTLVQVRGLWSRAVRLPRIE